MRQPEQYGERQVILEGTDGNLVRQQRIGVFQLGEQKVGHAADRGARTLRLIEHRLECDGVDFLPVQQSFELLAEKPGRQPQKESAVQIALSSADPELEAKDVSRRVIGGYRFTRSGKDQPACAALDYRDPKPSTAGNFVVIRVAWLLALRDRRTAPTLAMDTSLR